MNEYLLGLLPGLKVSLTLTFSAIIIAFFLAIACTLALARGSRAVGILINSYLTLFTGTPMLVQFFLIYYGPGQFPVLQHIGWLWNLLSQPWFCAVVALALNSAAYTTQLFYGSLTSIATSQWQACAALGMSNKQSLALLLPFALKRAVSAYSNEIILVFKGTSLAYTITLMDIMGLSQRMYGNNYDVSVFIAAGVIYLAVNLTLTLLLRFVERRALRFERRSA